MRLCLVMLGMLFLPRCNGDPAAALRSHQAGCEATCIPTADATATPLVCPSDACRQGSGTVNTTVCPDHAQHLVNLAPTGEIRIGQVFMAPEVIGWDDGFCPRLPTVTWAMALAHAARILQLYNVRLSAHEFLAIAIKESTLGCSPAFVPCAPFLAASAADGCFQMTCSTAYTQMRQTYGARFNAPHCAVIFGDHFESSALAKAFYDRYTWAVLKGRDPALQDFFANARDPMALTKVMAYAYNQGVYEPALVSLFAGQRATCMALESITGATAQDPTVCLSNAAGHAYAWTVSRYTVALQDANAPVYDAVLHAADVSAYLDRIAAIYPEVNACANIRSALLQRFAEVADKDGTVAFRTGFGDLLDALLVLLPQPEDPMAGLNATF